MAETPTDVLVAGYQDIDAATRDFETLITRVKAKEVEVEGAILVTHDQAGNVSVRQTADHLGRTGAKWGAGVGLVVGLFAPPTLLATLAAGAVAGGLLGKFVDHRLATGIHDKIGENLPAGSAGIIAVFDDEQRLGVEQTLVGALLRSIVQSDKEGVSALKESLAEAMGKFNPDRTVLPIPDRNFGGTIGRTLDESVGDWTIVPGPKAPDGAPNVLICLIDDAGFGQPDTFGGPIRTPNMTRVQNMGLTYNRFHVTALCSPTRAALLTGRNHHRVGFGSIAEYPGPFPGMEGTDTGSFNEMTFLNTLVLAAGKQLELIEHYGGVEALGGPHTAPHYAAAWAHAGNTPFQYGKQTSSHLGGTRNPMVVAWPNRIKASDDPRSQFTHCIDVAPTVLEMIDIPEPKTVDGIDQEPMDGISFAYTVDDAGADERHTVQYFEFAGNRGIYKDGWWASSRPDRLPWDFSPETLKRFGPGSGWDPDRDAPWELYYLPDDFSQAHNIAAEHPDKVSELQELFWAEAERNRVLPLMGGVSVIYGLLPPLPTTTRFRFHGDVQNVQRGMIPRIFGRSYAIEAELEIPPHGAEGVIVANADFIGGFALWVDEKRLLHHTYSFLGVETYQQTSTAEIPTGHITVKMLFEADEPKPGTGGKVTLWANDEQIGGGTMPHTVPIAFSSYAGMDIGRDNGLVVDLAYEDKAPYAFTGTVKQVVFDLKPVATQAAEKALHEAAQHHGLAQGVAA